MEINVWCRTDKGLRRDSNQDSFLTRPELGLYIVADGMGGHSGGEVASAMAVQAVAQFVQKNLDSMQPRELLLRAYQEASRQIHERAAQEQRLSGMGTTMVLLFIKEDMIYVANVGDSRAYLFRKPFYWQLTEDHSLMNEQLRAGILKEENVATFTSKNVITRSVGYEKNVQADVIQRELVTGDCYLICSDGFSGMVSDKGANEILNSTEPGRVPDLCIAKALENGGDDNVTVLFLTVT
jgi:serine/threonine protein phosphatase PrpC